MANKITLAWRNWRNTKRNVYGRNVKVKEPEKPGIFNVDQFNDWITSARQPDVVVGQQLVFLQLELQN